MTLGELPKNTEAGCGLGEPINVIEGIYSRIVIRPKGQDNRGNEQQQSSFVRSSVVDIMMLGSRHPCRVRPKRCNRRRNGLTFDVAVPVDGVIYFR